MADVPGLHFIRHRFGLGHDYFVANQSLEFIDTWIRLAVPFKTVLIMDPMTGKTGCAQVRGQGAPEVRLQLAPGSSLILRTSANSSDNADAWLYLQPDTQWHTVSGTWRVEFIDGGPVLPAGYSTEELSSWTVHGEEAQRFAGTARYSLQFDAPSAGETWVLDLGTVHASARVRLNGVETDILIGPCFRTVLHDIKQTANALEIEVTNLAANRIRDLDKRGVAWKIFKDINFVNSQYKPFIAVDWPVMPSGLLGPVRLGRVK